MEESSASSASSFVETSVSESPDDTGSISDDSDLPAYEPPTLQLFWIATTHLAIKVHPSTHQTLHKINAMGDMCVWAYNTQHALAQAHRRAVIVNHQGVPVI